MVPGFGQFLFGWALARLGHNLVSAGDKIIDEADEGTCLYYLAVLICRAGVRVSTIAGWLIGRNLEKSLSLRWTLGPPEESDSE